MNQRTLNGARRLSRRGIRRGSMLIELLASFGVLTTVFVVATPLVVRHGRLLTAARQYRIAVEELSNQLERLTALPGDELRARLPNLAPSEFATTHLHGAELTARLAPADVGERLTLEIVWDEPQRQGAPVRLVAWIAPEPAATDAPDAPDGEEDTP
jgi:hypothetical protein